MFNTAEFFKFFSIWFSVGQCLASRDFFSLSPFDLLSTSMGESTSVFIWRFVKLKCAYGDLRILTISRIKRSKKNVLFRFRSAIWSDPYTRPLADPCFLKLTRVHALLEVVKIVVNWQHPCFIQPRSPEQFEKNAVFVRGLWAFRRHWQKCEKQMELEVDSGGGRGWSTVSTLMSKVRWAEGCN